MYIYEIIIDGFKSYAQRTVVSGFDPQFNAITGLNGSGKSNILDAICFVLGISNLSQVRVGNLQELVYKQGQAGVTKATVTIVFDNSDPSNSPVAYESCKQITVTRQVVIGGKNKYMINGRTVQQSEVQNLFHSVQLNVNNPHFLIMQGRITKVLNMKPIEILGMIEEAAGTRMFETKKQAAIKTIEKKQLKVDELTKCMNEEITPTLDSLRTERQQYQSWLINNTEIEKLDRLCIAHTYIVSEEKVKSSEQDKQQIVTELESYQNIEKNMTQEIEEYSKKILDIQKIRENEMDGPLATLKKQENELSKDLVKMNTTITNQKETLQSEKETNKSLVKQIDTVTNSYTKKEKDLSIAETKMKTKEIEMNEVEKQAHVLRDKYQNICAGVVDDDSNATMLSLPEQIVTWEKRMRESESKLKQGKLKSDHAKTSLKELTKSKALQDTNQDKYTQQITTHQTTIKQLESQLHITIQGYDKTHSSSNNNSMSVTEALVTLEQKEATLRQDMSALTKHVAQCKDTMNTLSAQVEARLNFNYKDPERGFDRSKVKGMVAKLLRVSESKYATALEIVGGGKLYQVVTDTEVTAKLILQKGALKKRVTMLPLNKIDNRVLDKNKLNLAKSIAQKKGGEVYLALELIQYDDSVKKAMEYTFGNTLICDNSTLAQEIAFHPQIRTKTVTLEGDSYDPSGTLTGGSNTQLGTLLNKISELAQISEQYHTSTQQVHTLQLQLNELETVGNAIKEIQRKVEIEKQELNLIQNKVSDSDYSRVVTEMESLQEQIDLCDKESITLKDTYDHAKTELNNLKNTQHQVKSKREQAMKEFEQQMKSAQKLASAVKTEFSSLKTKYDTLSAEIVTIQQDVISLQEQLTISDKTIVKLSDQIDQLSMEMNNCREQYETVKKTVQDKQNQINQSSKEIKTLETAKDKCTKTCQNASLEIRKITHKLKQWEQENKDIHKKIVAMTRQYTWIESEKQYFGKKDTDYDFTTFDIQESQKRLSMLKNEQEKLMKKVNKKVMGMIEKAENEYKDLSQKREVILKDKAKIETVIEELDVKKIQALQTTWNKVNQDFGSIFSTLLPGTSAKLEPVEGTTVSDGLEVKVAFNNVWKDSLTELSGGQRSLLALSLILGLLLFKPAPMYILDEVDAALDLSHTQNIGIMLRTHFSTSQFIVVSLKEGMFNNANVIFRTRFVDGVSTVTRTVVGGKNRPQQQLVSSSQQEDENETDAPKKKKGKGLTTSNASSTTSNKSRNIEV